MKTLSKFILLSLFLFQNCIEPISLHVQQSEQLLVVEGRVTNNADPQNVKLSYTSKIGSDPNEYAPPIPAQNAIVRIIDSDGNETHFTETPDGNYKSNTELIGQTGKSYHIIIEIGNKVYSSSPQEILEPVPIDSIYHRFLIAENKIDVFINSTDPSATKNYYLWSWNGYYLIFANLEDDIDCCARCYINTYGTDINIMDDLHFNGNPITNHFIAKLPVERPTDYLIEVSQQSVSQATFEYYKQLYDQLNNSGSLFDPPFTKVIGNVFNESDVSEPVLGYFLVAGSSKKFTQIPRKKYYNRSSQPIFNGDCRLAPQSDTLKPVNWIINF